MPAPRPRPPVPTLGPELDFLRVLWDLAHVLRSGSKRQEQALGLTGPQQLVLRIVGRFPGISAGQLAHILHSHPSTLTGVLRRLVARGLIDRRAAARDPRRAALGLTAAGRALDAPGSTPIETATSRLLARMPATKVAAAREVLELLTECLRSPDAEGEPVVSARPRDTPP